MSRWTERSAQVHEFPQREASKVPHEEAIAYLRQRHPRTAIAGDFGLILPAMFPDNMQTYNQNLYTGAQFAQTLYRETIDSPQWYPDNPHLHPVAGPLDAYQCLLLMCAHPQRHVGQIAELRT